MAQLKINTTIDGQTAWHAGNDGTGSGLDADLLDGQEASAFALAGHAHSLDSLSDVTITTPADNSVLAYDSGTGTWIDQTAAEAGLATTGHSHDADYVNVTGDTMTGLLTIAGSADATPTDGTGLLQVGSSGGINLGIDGNEIVARNGAGAESPLYINASTIFLQAPISTDSTLGVGGSATIDGSIASLVGGLGLILKTQTPNDHVYIGFYARESTPNTRTGYIGYPSAASTTLQIQNEITNGDVRIDAVGTGQVLIEGSRALTVADEGTGNGLDADTVDGQHASAFATSTHTHAAGDITSGSFGVARGGTGITTYTAGNYINALNSTTLQQRTPAQVLSDIGAAAASHNHDASNITTGILGVARGGTGIGSYTTGNYINAASSSSLQQRTPAQVLSDIGAASSSHNHDAAYVNATGDTMTGALTISRATGDALVVRDTDDSFDTFSVNVDGVIKFGNGSQALGNMTLSPTPGVSFDFDVGSANFNVYTTGEYNIFNASEIWLGSNTVVNGTLTLDADPTTNLQAATKQYVDTNDVHRSDTAPASPAVGKLWLDTDDTTGNPVQEGYRLYTTVVYTSSGTFTKANYPGIKAVRVKVQAAGGGGVGNGNGNGTGGPGGGGGGYAEAFILASSLAAGETVTVGSGGSGSTGFSVGGDGGASGFGTLVTANGGSGGEVSGLGGLRGLATAGDILLNGSDGHSTSDQSATNLPGGNGGDSFLGSGGRGGARRSTDTGGAPGRAYGGGGGGGYRVSGLTTAGDGAPGIVIVEVYV